jgi:protein-S-isoprenylcysteine O-methyltransferase Ste14
MVETGRLEEAQTLLGAVVSEYPESAEVRSLAQIIAQRVLLVKVQAAEKALWLARHDPGLLNERLGSFVQRDQKGWDKIFMVTVLVLWFAWFALMGLDVRYHWSDVPLYAQVVGFLLLVLGCTLVGLTFKANSFAAPVVKIQKERAHRVISSGPYAYVRHPMYAGALLINIGAPLLLGSWWGLVFVPLFVGLFVLRIGIEERTLRTALQGYDAYAARVRYRVIPLIW